MSYCNCEYCGNSMATGQKMITQFGLADICSSQCLMEANNDETTSLPFRQFRQKKGFDSIADLARCCVAGMNQQNENS